MRLQVIGWNDHFENAKSRQRDKCGYVCTPNKQHGMGFTNMMCESNGASLYGIWCLIIGALSRQSRLREGYLTDTGRPDGCPWTVRDMAVRWRRTESEISNAIHFFLSDKCGWVKDLDLVGHVEVTTRTPDGHLADTSGDEGIPLGNGREGKEGKGIRENIPPLAGNFSADVVLMVLSSYPRQEDTDRARYHVERSLSELSAEGIADPAAHLIERAKLYGQKMEPKFQKSAFNWFAGKIWKDDPETWERPANGKKKKSASRPMTPDELKIMDTWTDEDERTWPGGRKRIIDAQGK